MATGRFFQQVNLPGQKSYDDDDIVFPVVLSPATDTNVVFEEAIRAEKPWLDFVLQKNGALLFRGFNVNSPIEFNNIVEAFGFPEFPNLGGRAPRTKIIGRVYTANESPLDKRIPFHHELVYNLDFPSKLFFYCEEEPGKGGETAIVLSHVIHEKICKSHPELVAKLEKHGVTYITIAGDEDHSSAIGGISWKSAYLTDDKNIAEESSLDQCSVDRAAKLGAKLEWMGNAVKIISGPRPAIRFNEENQRKTWFLNHGFVPMKSNTSDHGQYFELGNGDLVPDHAINECLKIMEEECVAIPWNKGDVMLINNLMVLHSRLPLITPPRRILASLCKLWKDDLFGF